MGPSSEIGPIITSSAPSTSIEAADLATNGTITANSSQNSRISITTL